VRCAVPRRPCGASPGAIEFASGEAPRRYNSQASGAVRLLPTRASKGTVLIQPTEMRRYRGMPADASRSSVRGIRPTVRVACKGCPAGYGRPLWRSHKIGRQIGRPRHFPSEQGQHLPLRSSNLPVPMPLLRRGSVQPGSSICETATSGWRRRKQRMGQIEAARERPPRCCGSSPGEPPLAR
jgi:hypothetical protein